MASKKQKRQQASAPIALTEEQRDIIRRIEETTQTFFITGRAGTGKSTIIDHFMGLTKKTAVKLAPTGVAALNIGGHTIHSFFGFPTNLTEEKFLKLRKDEEKYRALDTIIIDEISMVRADMLDFIDRFLGEARRKPKAPFGGCQMVFIGDLYQLPPVVEQRERGYFREAYGSEYFFSAQVVQKHKFRIVELNDIFRQRDLQFIQILNAIRHNDVGNEHLAILNSRCDPEFEPPEEEFFLTLCTRRDLAAQINTSKLERLRGPLFVSHAEIVGDVEPGDFPAEAELNLKKNAQVMFIRNDPYGRWVNGSIGIVTAIDTENQCIYVELSTGDEVEVERETWIIEQVEYDKRRKRLQSVAVGQFIQFPLSLSWAITIHKSQGKTFEKVIVDLGKGIFAGGQLYVALSRCTSLDGLVLRQRIEPKHIRLDHTVLRFFSNYYVELAETIMTYEAKRRLLEESIQRQIPIDIRYLNARNIVSTRRILPHSLEEKEYRGTTFVGLTAFDHKRGEVRTFQPKRILEILNIQDILTA